MSPNVPAEALAFDEVIDRYQSCKASPDRHVPFFTPLNKTLRPTGKVRVSASDFVADVDLAMGRALAGLNNEKNILQKVLVEDDQETYRSLSQAIGHKEFLGVVKEIKRRVGKEFISCGIYPLSRYAAPVDVR